MSDLHQQLISAHANDDLETLATLYTKAADIEESSGNTDAACFYLTQAYIFALDAGLPAANDINKRLADYGRDQLA